MRDLRNQLAASRYAWTLGIILGACGSSPLHAPDNVYRRAFQYLQESPRVAQYCREDLRYAPADCRLAPADSTIFPSVLFFLRDLAAMRGVPAEKLIDSVTSDDIARGRTFRSTALDSTLKGDPRPTVSVFFSSLNGPMLVAEVVGPHIQHQSYAQATQSGAGLAFLFWFDDRGQISQVFTKRLQYN